jgi:hypothetical protein
MEELPLLGEAFWGIGCDTTTITFIRHPAIDAAPPCASNQKLPTKDQNAQKFGGVLI